MISSLIAMLSGLVSAVLHVIAAGLLVALGVGLVLAWPRIVHWSRVRYTRFVRSPIPSERLRELERDPSVSVDALIEAHTRLAQARIPVDLDRLVAHARAGGDVLRLSTACVQARRGGSPLDFEALARADLEGRDPCHAVRDAGAPA